MITNAFLYIVYGWLTGLRAVLSNVLGAGDVHPMGALVGSVNTASSYISATYATLPDTMIALLGCLAFLLVFLGVYGLYLIIRWAYQKIPGVT